MALRSALAWSVIGQFIAFFASFATSVIVARLLSPRDLGIYAIASATVSVLNTFTAFGIGTYVIRLPTVEKSTLACAFTINGLLSVVLALIILAASAAESRIYDNSEIARVLLPLAFVPIIGIFEFLPSTMLQREMDFRSLAISNTGRIIVSMICIVILAINDYSYMSLAYGNLLAAVFGAAYVNAVAGRYALFRLSMTEARQMTVFGLRMMSIGGVARLAQRLSDIILGNLLGLVALGLYSRASSISNLIFENVYGAVTRVLFVQLSNDYRDRGILRDSYLAGLEMITALIWPLLVGLAVLSRPAIYILYGEQWLDAALPLSLLMVAQVVVLCFGMNWELFILRDETARQARFEAIRAVAGVVTFTVGSLFSISAAAVGRIAEAAFGMALYRPHMDRMAGSKPGEITAIYVRSAGLTAVAVLPAFGLMVATHWSYRTSPLLIGGAVLAGGCLWLLLLAWLAHPIFREIRSATRKIAAGLGGMRVHRRPG